ncbi:class IV adenylate cyclase [Methanolobus halotolerans]|uniref:Class IV adenylate cyclase n=1 Tax=Methanolobus halotolerans TaxID=2052935 RepID=A0A4E0PUT1_9EURY|nr:class IV adenylate cyclase [Methanolobus halotolerans]TGC08973.1 class IV adenylate cyclase [Methanolobus halotolerans]
MIEIEVKARVDHQQAKQLLSGMGANFIGVEKHYDTYFNAPHRDFANTDEALRIRSVDGRSVLTYKGKKLETVAKTREEFETEVDGSNTRSILLALGFYESGVVRKTREIFRFKGLTICIDNVRDIGEFIEVEITTESDIEFHNERIFAFLEKFGIREEDSIRTSYLEMVLEQNEEK